MSHSPLRRRLLLSAGLLPLLRPAQAAGGRVVIVGGGWGGLTVAKQLHQLAPQLEITLLDRAPAFMSFALSNRWLVEPAAPAWARYDYAQIAGRFGYRYVQGEVQSIDPVRHTIASSAGQFGYDWLVLAPGIRENWSAWQVDDPKSAAELRARYGGGMLSAADLPALKQRLTNFKGGDLLLTIPPAPYRCPPAPYERAMFIAGWLKQQKIPGKLIVADPNPIMPAFRDILLSRFKEQVVYLDHAKIRSIDPARKTVSTDIDDVRFDEALLSPPQQAADLLWQAGLIRQEAGGKASAWAAQGASDFRSPAGAGIFIIGDAAGLVSPQFGYFPKTGQVANRMGHAVARQIAAEAGGPSPEISLPESVCHVSTSIDPAESVRIDTRYRDRGDGFLLQTVQQTRNSNPAGEDADWAAALYRDFL